jgi:hypothetical protein
LFGWRNGILCCHSLCILCVMRAGSRGLTFLDRATVLC